MCMLPISIMQCSRSREEWHMPCDALIDTWFSLQANVALQMYVGYIGNETCVPCLLGTVSRQLRRESWEIRDSALMMPARFFRPPMTSYEIFWEKSLDTKCLMAWSRKEIILVFRGTASLLNVVADMQVIKTLRTPLTRQVVLCILRWACPVIMYGPFSCRNVRSGRCFESAWTKFWKNTDQLRSSK